MIIVTGGAGFIGRHLVRRLESEGEKVLVLDNYWRNYLGNKDYVNNDSCDITNEEKVSFRFADLSLIHI